MQAPDCQGWVFSEGVCWMKIKSVTTWIHCSVFYWVLDPRKVWVRGTKGAQHEAQKYKLPFPLELFLKPVCISYCAIWYLNAVQDAQVCILFVFDAHSWHQTPRTGSSYWVYPVPRGVVDSDLCGEWGGRHNFRKTHLNVRTESWSRSGWGRPLRSTSPTMSQH